MIFNFTKVTTIVSEINCSILGWFCTSQNTSRRDVASDQQHQGNQAGGMFGLLVSGDASNRH
jgi:hypothetical protein